METDKVTTGVPGLDSILIGGLLANRVYLVQGRPGTGKTTFGLQFLLEGKKKGEKCLLISVFETRKSIEQVAASHGWSLDGIEIHEFTSILLSQDLTEQSVFHPADLELTQRTQAMLEIIDKVKPDRFVLDSMAELRMISDTPLRYRRQMFTLKAHLSGMDCTSLVLDFETNPDREKDLQDIVDGVFLLEQNTPDYGSVRPYLEITKLLGMPFQTGLHSYRIQAGGITVFPRLTSPNEIRHPKWQLLESGNEQLDTLLGGGLEQGTSCLLLGPTGTGKSTIATLFAHAAAKRGQHTAFFIFDERTDTYIYRSQKLNMNILPFIESGMITLNEMDVASIAPSEFSQMVRHIVENSNCKVVVIDSLAGYYNAMPQEPQLLVNLHELLSYLSYKGVLSLLIMAQHGFIGHEMRETISASYIADSIVLLRHFESGGALHQAISVVKKRHSGHERTLREMHFTASGVEIGEPLSDFSAVLSGTPVFTGSRENLKMSKKM